MKCTCKGFYKPYNCPVHGKTKRHTPDKIVETIAVATMTIENLQPDTLIRDILKAKGYGNQAIEETRSLLQDIVMSLEEK